jgi:hypothetical protein
MNLIFMRSGKFLMVVCYKKRVGKKRSTKIIDKNKYNIYLIPTSAQVFVLVTILVTKG